MGSDAIIFCVAFFFLGLSESGVLVVLAFGLYMVSSCLISFWSCLISLSSWASCWSNVFFIVFLFLCGGGSC